MPASASPDKPAELANWLLASLPPADYEPLGAHLKPVLLTSGQILYNPWSNISQVYFVTTGTVSQTLIAQGGQPVEVGMTGREGLVGAEALLPDNPTLYQAMVQIPGKALRLPADIFRDHYRQNERFQESVLRYQQFMMAQRAQSAVCNALHKVEQRLSRWLLLTHDRANGDELELTQELLATMLAVRRAGVTVAAGALRAAGLIQYHRGQVMVLDRAGLEKAACECYGSIRKQEALLLPRPNQ